ncbi:NUMOD4 domain-containing protein [Lactiplantibacillus plantarum]|uniref:NUMOD4 domain-containing protein n=1 Tax=Lactiplantibacillus plantarum TaxID=1590 RepID=UPI001CFC5562|nr:NUMOD4 domain-containing protein [Lactiplantibacillus plantarum]WQC49596.1 NUMOD4 domain-containing protein [Lactiplantibacillus plantarum]WQG55455.1 NUMOD4 domain-containing protein [Lactiplantibacillus plantarum]GJI54476.1 HNH endonuclease [Lactiplantibacillus plantarum]
MNKNSKVVEAELWRDIAGYNGAYQVSSLGNVRSVDRVIKLSNGNQRHLIGHLIQPHDNGLGYQQVNLIDTDHKLHAMLVHKLVLDTFMPLSSDESKTLSDCHHVNANRKDNRLSNLARVTHRDNLIEQHRMQQIRQAVHCVDANGEIVLKAESMTKMAELLGVSQTAISAHVNSGKPLATGLTVVRDNDTDKQVETKEVA